MGQTLLLVLCVRVRDEQHVGADQEADGVRAPPRSIPPVPVEPKAATAGAGTHRHRRLARRLSLNPEDRAGFGTAGCQVRHSVAQRVRQRGATDRLGAGPPSLFAFS